MEKRKKKKKLCRHNSKKIVTLFITGLGMEWFIVLFCQEKSNIWLFRRIPEGVIIPLPKGRFKELKRNKKKSHNIPLGDLLYTLRPSVLHFFLQSWFDREYSMFVFFTAGKMCTAGVSMYLGAGTVTTWVMVCQTLVVLKDSPLDDESVSMLLNSSPL